jgi:hypothetical protein
LAYVIGFFVMLAVLGWHPDAEHRKRVQIPITPTVVSIGPTIQVQWEAA